MPLASLHLHRPLPATPARLFSANAHITRLHLGEAATWDLASLGAIDEGGNVVHVRRGCHVEGDACGAFGNRRVKCWSRVMRARGG